jgi:hypothetical protein
MVEAYAGRVDPSEKFLDRFTRIMQPAEVIGDRVHRYRAEVFFEEAGRFGVNVRVTPNHPNPESRHSMGLVLWGQG